RPTAGASRRPTRWSRLRKETRSRAAGPTAKAHSISRWTSRPSGTERLISTSQCLRAVCCVTFTRGCTFPTKTVRIAPIASCSGSMNRDGTRSSRALRATSCTSTSASRGRRRRCSSPSDHHGEELDMTDEKNRGMQVRREVLGDEYVDRAEASRTPLTDEFQDLITRYAWGEIWARPG